MVAEHPNAAVVRRFFAAQAAGDVGTLAELLAQDVVWHLPAGAPP